MRDTTFAFVVGTLLTSQETGMQVSDARKHDIYDDPSTLMAVYTPDITP